ncbi:hypothetical protein ABZ413_17345 [Nocardia rhamnosiphila]|uniref:hypothetical protein n=1 Tax=Nocardia rhamnosiphila TaxID=426716 RepID=UPI0033C71A39
MTGTDLRKWADNFTALRAKVVDYEQELAQIQTTDPTAASRRGPGQVIGFQTGHILHFLGFGPRDGNPPWLMDPTSIDPDRDQHFILLARYFLELMALRADEPLSLADTRKTLIATLDRVRDLAWKWAKNGVDAAELEVVMTEARELAEKARSAAEKLNS